MSEELTELSFTVSGYISRPPAEVYEAVADPEQLSQYFTTGGARGRLEPGAEVTWDFADFPGRLPNALLAPAGVAFQEASVIVTSVRAPSSTGSNSNVVVVRGISSQLLHDEERELCFVVEQPVQVEEPLIDHILIGRSLVFEDDRRVVLIDTERIDASTMPVSR